MARKADAVRQLFKSFWAECRAMERLSLNQPGHEKYTKHDIDEILSWLSLNGATEHMEALHTERDAALAPKPGLPRRTALLKHLSRIGIRSRKVGTGRLFHRHRLRMFPLTLEEHGAKPLDWKSLAIATEEYVFLGCILYRFIFEASRSHEILFRSQNPFK